MSRSRLSGALLPSLLAVLLVTSMVSGVVVVGTAGAQEEPSTPVDVVFVVDRSANMEPVAENVSGDLPEMAGSLDEAGVDARYAMVTYEDGSTVETGFGDADTVANDMLTLTHGGVFEDASDGVVTASELEFREDATRMYVVLTNEDDTSTAAVREDADSILGADGAAFFVAGPDSWADRAASVGGTHYDWPAGSEDARPGDSGADAAVDLLGETILGAASEPTETETPTATPEQAPRPSPSPDMEIADVRYNRTELRVGQPVRITATVSNTGTASGEYDPYLRSDMEIVAQGGDGKTIPVGESRTFTFTHRFEERGTALLELRHEYLDQVDVAGPPETTTNVSAVGGNGAQVRVSHVREGSNVTVSLPGTAAANDTGVQFERLGLRTDRSRSLDLSARQTTAAPATATELPGREIAALTVEGSAADALDRVTVRFSVNRTEHPDIGADAVTLRHVTDEGVGTVEPTVVERTDDRYTFEAAVPGASTYVVAAREPAFTVTNATLSATEYGLWDGVDVTATVRNDGASGAQRVPITLDGEVYRTERVRVPGNGSRTVTLSFTATRKGEQAVAVGNASAGTITVETARPVGPMWQAMLPNRVLRGEESPQDTAERETATDDGSTDTNSTAAD